MTLASTKNCSGDHRLTDSYNPYNICLIGLVTTVGCYSAKPLNNVFLVNRQIFEGFVQCVWLNEETHYNYMVIC